MLQLAPMILLLGKKLFFFCLFERSPHQFIRLLTYAILNISPPTYFPLSIFSSLSLSLCVWVFDWLRVKWSEKDRETSCVCCSPSFCCTRIWQKKCGNGKICFNDGERKKTIFRITGFPLLFFFFFAVDFCDYLEGMFLSLSLDHATGDWCCKTLLWHTYLTAKWIR